MSVLHHKISFIYPFSSGNFCFRLSLWLSFSLIVRYQNAAVCVSMGDQEIFFIFILQKVLRMKYERRMIISITDYNAKDIAVYRFRHGLSQTEIWQTELLDLKVALKGRIIIVYIICKVLRLIIVESTDWRIRIAWFYLTNIINGGQ